MKNKIEAVFDPQKFTSCSSDSQEIFVADYTQRTASVRSVEVHDTKPADIESLEIFNRVPMQISTSIFSPQCFADAYGRAPKQCECVMSPATLLPHSWIVFIEIKDCKPGNASNYHSECKEKIIENVQLFRDKNIIASDKVVYAVVSFPRKAKTNFHRNLIKPPEQKLFRETYKILIKGTNKIIIENERKII